jgi:hypothetical protein
MSKFCPSSNIKEKYYTGLSFGFWKSQLVITKIQKEITDPRKACIVFMIIFPV